MGKEWFIFINDNREGPYTPDELHDDPRVTLNTLAWRIGMAAWLPIREIPELRKFVSESRDEEEYPQEEVLAKTGQRPPVRWWMIILIGLVCGIYAVYAGFYLAEWIKNL